MRRARLVAALLAALGPAAAGAGEPAAAGQPLAPLVTVVAAAKQELVERAIVTGTLVPREEVLVSAEVDGLRITEVLAEEGDSVAAGQVLARLSREMPTIELAQNAATLARVAAAIAQAESQIAQAQAAWTEADQALQRTRKLARSGNAPQAALEQRIASERSAEAQLAAGRQGLAMAEAERRAALAEREELELRLARTEVKAPVGGVVSRRSARVGATAAAAGEPLFRLIAEGAVELEGEVTETLLPRIREGAPVAVTIGGETIRGAVRRVMPEVDPATRLGKVRIGLGQHPALRIGSFARGSIELARRTGIAVPLGAVLHGPQGASVQVATGARIETRPVRTGLTAGDLTEIVEGIAEGEHVVARAGTFLRHGDAVRTELAAAPAAATSP